MPRGQASPELRKLRRLIAKTAAEERRSRRRFYITRSFKPPLMRPDSSGRMQYVNDPWPNKETVFKTEKEAWAYAQTHAHVSGAGIWEPPPDHRKVMSYALTSFYLPKPDVTGSDIIKLIVD